MFTGIFAQSKNSLLTKICTSLYKYVASKGVNVNEEIYSDTIRKRSGATNAALPIKQPLRLEREIKTTNHQPLTTNY